MQAGVSTRSSEGWRYTPVPAWPLVVPSHRLGVRQRRHLWVLEGRPRLGTGGVCLPDGDGEPLALIAEAVLVGDERRFVRVVARHEMVLPEDGLVGDEREPFGKPLAAVVGEAPAARPVAADLRHRLARSWFSYCRT